MTKCAVVTLWLALCLILVSPRQAAADAVTDWNATAGQAALAACISPIQDPLHESRLYAMMHVAIHDALNAIDRRSRPYAFRARSEWPVSPNAAVAAAARGVLARLIGEIGFPFPPAVHRGRAWRSSKQTTGRRSPSFQKARQRRRASGSERRPPQPFLRSGHTTGPTRRCWISRTPRAANPASIGSRPGSISRSRLDGGR